MGKPQAIALLSFGFLEFVGRACFQGGSLGGLCEYCFLAWIGEVVECSMANSFYRFTTVGFESVKIADPGLLS